MSFNNPAWINPIESTFDEGKPIRSEQGLMLAGNPIAIAQGAAGAPVVATGWHPYDMSYVSDGNTGLIYDYSVDGGVNTVYSPTFEDGYQYAIYSTDIEMNINTSLEVSVEMSDGSFDFINTVDALKGNPTNIFIFSFPFPRILRGSYNSNSQFTGSTVKDVRFRVQVEDIGDITGNTTAGSLYLLRRREYVTG